eukprot:4125127-Prymnesium_polylepis.3
MSERMRGWHLVDDVAAGDAVGQSTEARRLSRVSRLPSRVPSSGEVARRAGLYSDICATAWAVAVPAPLVRSLAFTYAMERKRAPGTAP